MGVVTRIPAYSEDGAQKIKSPVFAFTGNIGQIYFLYLGIAV
jgi:hypothetical protein